MIDADVSGVWCMVHTSVGDYPAQEIVGVWVNGATVTFGLRCEGMSSGATATGSTLHVGRLAVDTPITPPETVGRGGSFTIIHKVEMCDLGRGPCPEPRR